MWGYCQNFRSAPQKQPNANTACCKCSGNGGAIGLPVIKCRLVMGIGVDLPASALAGSGKTSFFDEKIMAYGMLENRMTFLMETT